MINWLGQDIKVGDWVYRGARQGDSSEYKAGKVKTMAEGKNPRVDWIFQPTDGGKKIYESRSSGSPRFESLVKLTGEVADRLDIMNEAMVEFDFQVPVFDHDEFFDSRSVPKIQYSWGSTYDYNSPEYDTVRAEYDILYNRRKSDRNNFVNNRLVAAGYPPI